MMRALVLVSLLCAATTPAGAQRSRASAPPPVSSGLWFAAGLGGGWASVNCAICADAAEGGLSGFMRLGGVLSSRVLIGAEVAAWAQQDGGVDQSAWALSAAALWYPSRRPYYLKGGFGYTTHHADDGVDVVTTWGIGPQVGAGYDLPIATNWMLSPFVNASFGMIMGQVKFNAGTVTNDASVRLLQIGVGVTRR